MHTHAVIIWWCKNKTSIFYKLLSEVPKISWHRNCANMNIFDILFISNKHKWHWIFIFIIFSKSQRNWRKYYDSFCINCDWAEEHAAAYEEEKNQINQIACQLDYSNALLPEVWTSYSNGMNYLCSSYNVVLLL